MTVYSSLSFFPFTGKWAWKKNVAVFSRVEECLAWVGEHNEWPVAAPPTHAHAETRAEEEEKQEEKRDIIKGNGGESRPAKKAKVEGERGGPLVR